MSSKSSKCLGFTLTELMVTVSIAAILLSIAIPSFTDLIHKNRLTAVTNSFLTSLSYARNEAIKRGRQVTMENNGDWSGGWNICVDGDSPPDNSCNNADVDEQLRIVEAVPSGYTISTTSANGYADYAAFLGDGLPKSASGATFNICEGSNTSTSRKVTISSTGRAHVDAEGGGTC